MTEEPYRWLEAMQNRREYIEDQLRPAAPVVVVQGTPGLLLLTLKASTPKLFEIYDHLCLGCLGHPADLEKIRQAAIDTAHVEGFTRSPRDVSARRLVSYALSPALKSAFEQIFTAPLLMRALLAELGTDPSTDQAWSLDYDGTFTCYDAAQLRHGVFISGSNAVRTAAAAIPLMIEATLLTSWNQLADQALRWLAWTHLAQSVESTRPWDSLPTSPRELLALLPASTLECAVLDRALYGSGTSYRSLAVAELWREA